MRKSLKRKSLKRNISRKSRKLQKRKRVKRKSFNRKLKLKGGGLVEETQKTELLDKYKAQIIKLLKTTKLEEKNDTLLKSITNKVTKTGDVYDFIFETTDKLQITNSNVIIWSHGTKNKLEPLTAGKAGIHAYVQINDGNISILGLVLTN